MKKYLTIFCLDMILITNHIIYVQGCKPSHKVASRVIPRQWHARVFKRQCQVAKVYEA